MLARRKSTWLNTKILSFLFNYSKELTVKKGVHTENCGWEKKKENVKRKLIRRKCYIARFEPVRKLSHYSKSNAFTTRPSQLAFFRLFIKTSYTTTQLLNTEKSWPNIRNSSANSVNQTKENPSYIKKTGAWSLIRQWSGTECSRIPHHAPNNKRERRRHKTNRAWGFTWSQTSQWVLLWCIII